MKINEAMSNNAKSYAISVITERALPYIDGFKPVQRRIVYTMDSLKLYSTTKKSARIVGDCMGKYHPHGDRSIYDSLCNMTERYAGFNSPFIKGQGSFGSADMARSAEPPSAMRYTEVMLLPLAKTLVDGLDEGAVDFVDNFDMSEKEPALLPVQFPLIMVNTNHGIAVATASYAPSYRLEDVCNGTIAMLQKKVQTPAELAKILGAPDFPTGGYIHCDDALLVKLAETGKATFDVTAHYSSDKANHLIIDEAPAGVTFTRIMEQLYEMTKEPEGKPILGITEATGLTTSGIDIELRPGTDVAQFISDMERLTSARSTISINAEVITRQGYPRLLGSFYLLLEWIEFRHDCIRRQYTTRLTVAKEQEHKLAAWEHVGDHIDELLTMMRESNTEDIAKARVKQRFALDNIQVDYLFNLRMRSICKDKAEAAYKELADIRAKVTHMAAVVNSREAREAIMIEQLTDIRNKFSSPRVCRVADMISADEKKRSAAVIPNTACTVLVTKSLKVKCISKVIDISQVSKWVGTESLFCEPIHTTLDGTLLVYTNSGTCYKVAVNDIESNERQPAKQHIWDLVARKDNTDVFIIMDAGDYSGKFVIAYDNGNVAIVRNDAVAGNRRTYINKFDWLVTSLNCSCTAWMAPKENCYAVTASGKVAYCNFGALWRPDDWHKVYQIAKHKTGDPYIGFIPESKVNVPDDEVGKYLRTYTVKPKEPSLIAEVEKLRSNIATMLQLQAQNI